MTNEQNIGDVITVNYRGKEVQGKLVAPGVVQRCTRKGAKSYLVQCVETGEWCYCSQARMTNLRARHGSKGTRADVGRTYLSRPGKAIVKAREAEAKLDDEDDEGGLELSDISPVNEIVVDGETGDEIVDEVVDAPVEA